MSADTDVGICKSVNEDRVSDVQESALKEQTKLECFRYLEKFIYPLYHLLYLFIQGIIRNILSSSIIQFFLHFLFAYSIDQSFISPVTIILFTHSCAHRSVCFKAWQRQDDELYSREDVKCFDLLLEGLAFNRKFAPHVYLGVIPMNSIVSPQMRTRSIEHRLLMENLIEEPNKSNLRQGVDYWLVMKQLKEKWRLDRQLGPNKLGTKEGMEFLAQEVARMHRELESAVDELARPIYLPLKLTLNACLFNDTLKYLKEEGSDIVPYEGIGECMEQECQRLISYFEERYRTGHVKRCHGDLKTINMWISPSRFPLFSRKILPKQLLALDCIDFNPALYCIDTLSDVAMLAVDMEVRLAGTQSKHFTQYLVQHFLNTYLDRTGENQTQENRVIASTLLEYYMTEKAMACAHLFVMYNKSIELGKKYLDIALSHIEMLKTREIILPKVVRTTGPHSQ